MNDVSQLAATIGWDWADKKHDLCLRPAGSSKSEHIQLQQTPEAIHEWVAKLRQRFEGRCVGICIETSRGPAVAPLMAYDFIVIFPINPKALNSYRDAFCVSGAKADKPDSKLLEEYLRLHGDKLKPVQPDTVLTRTLAGLVEVRRQLVDDRTRLVLQMHSLLKTYYPLVETLFGKQLTTPLAAEFLIRWPDLAALKKADPAVLRAFFFKHNSRSRKTIEERLAGIANARELTTDQAIIIPARQRLLALAGMLRPLHESIAELEKKIEQAMDQHPDAWIFRSLPAAGPCLAPRLLVAFGTNRDRFANAGEVAQFYGIAPVVRQSGTSKTVHFRHRCPKFGRQTFHENAGCAIIREPWAASYHQEHKQRHDGRHHQANRSLAFKLIRIYFACWKHSKAYDPNRYLEALKKNGSPYHETVKPTKQAGE